MTSLSEGATLGVIAGGGALPLRLVEACLGSGRSCFVVALDGHADANALARLKAPGASFRVGAAGSIVEALRAAGVREVVMAGPVRRPSLAELRPDWFAARFFARVGLRALGDDGLLRAIAAEFEHEGFVVVGAHDILSPLLTPQGVLGHIVPDEAARADYLRGAQVARLLGAADVGQSVVVQQGIVLAVEAAEGTDALLSRTRDLRREGPGGVLVKSCKPQQDLRFDLPTIGPDTVERASKAGLRGIALSAGTTMILNRPQTIADADSLGLFLLGFKDEA